MTKICVEKTRAHNEVPGARKKTAKRPKVRAGGDVEGVSIEINSPDWTTWNYFVERNNAPTVVCPYKRWVQGPERQDTAGHGRTSKRRQRHLIDKHWL